MKPLLSPDSPTIGGRPKQTPSLRCGGVLPACGLIVALSPWMFAQNPSKSPSPQNNTRVEPVVHYIEGSVKEHLTLHPVESVRIELQDPSTGNVLADTETGADGKFILAGVAIPPGKYRVRAGLTNYENQEQEIAIAPSTARHAPVSFVLKCKPVEGTLVHHSVVRVFYATDRREGRAKLKWSHRISYDNVRDVRGTLSLGVCSVNVPETHQPTGIEKPPLWKLEFRPSPDRYLLVQSIQPETTDAFFRQLSAQVAASQEKEAFVFVHGYGLSFESAVQRTAQLAYDLGFRGAPILYSWASEASWYGYLTDEQRVRVTVDDLRNFLREVAQSSGAGTVHLIAHSMGNRALLTVLQQLQSESEKQSALVPFRDVILAAPDVDRSEFIRLVPQIRQTNRRITLYVSSADQVLLISQRLFHHETRAGEAGRDIIVLPGVDTIDVTRASVDMLGHSYYGNNRPVLRDLVHIFENHGTPREGLARALAGSLQYWVLTPDH